jgi:hypothetical protein
LCELGRSHKVCHGYAFRRGIGMGVFKVLRKLEIYLFERFVN